MRIATKHKLWLDVLIFVAFLILMQPALTGIPIHEWLATAAIAAFVTHLLGQWDWIIVIGRRFLARWERSRLNFILDVLLLLGMTTVFVSGYTISRSVLPVLGLPAGHDFIWRRLHALSADATLIIVAIHVAIHWRWIVSATQRYVFRPIVTGVRTIFGSGMHRTRAIEEVKP